MKLSPYYYKCPIGKSAIGLISRLWWRFIPGVTIKVRWPSGDITAGPGPSDPLWYDLGGAAYVKFYSADPNDHYRPWMESNVGKQGWDWDWSLLDDDLNQNRLTIKFRRGREQFAILAAIRWA